jgi:DNA-binding CsgD family transcriptional regulator
MPKLPPPPRSAQNSSASPSALACTSPPSTVTIWAASRLSQAIPQGRARWPSPPPRVNPAMPVLEIRPPVVASPNAWVSPREAEVLDAVGAHLSNAQIAHQLSISVRTVESHVSALLRKCGATSRRELAGLATVRPAGPRSHTDVERGEAALLRGDWEGERDAFQAALAAGAGARARNGLAQALWWLDQVTEAIEQRELAYAEFRREDDDRNAVTVALWLARAHLVTSGARAVSSGWLRRAERILAGTADCAERGWYHWLLAKMAESPADAVAEARRAFQIAVRCGDRDLEACALSELGLAEVMCGDVAQGMAELARRTGSRPLAGWATLAAAGTSSHPDPELDRAIDTFAEAGMPYFEGLARMRLAGLLGPVGTELAAAEAAAALRIFDALGAAGQAAQARALLDQLGR